MSAPDPKRYQLQVAASVSRALSVGLPEAVATAVLQLLTGDLLSHPKRVGKPLGQELTGLWSARRGEYRVLYEVDDDDRIVTVLDIAHRRDIYRSR